MGSDRLCPHGHVRVRRPLARSRALLRRLDAGFSRRRTSARRSISSSATPAPSELPKAATDRRREGPTPLLLRRSGRRALAWARRRSASRARAASFRARRRVDAQAARRPPWRYRRLSGEAPPPQRAFEQPTWCREPISTLSCASTGRNMRLEGEALLPERIGKVLRRSPPRGFSRWRRANSAPIAALDDLIDADRAVHDLCREGPAPRPTGRIDRADPQAQSGVRSRPGGESVCLGRLERAGAPPAARGARAQQLLGLDERERAEIVRLAQGGRALGTANTKLRSILPAT